MEKQPNLDQMPDFSQINVTPIDPRFELSDFDRDLLAGGVAGLDAAERTHEEPQTTVGSAFGGARRDFSGVNEAAFGTRPDFVVGAKDNAPKIDLKLGDKTLAEKMEEDRVVNAAKVAAKTAAQQWGTAFQAAEALRLQTKKEDEDDK